MSIDRDLFSRDFDLRYVLSSDFDLRCLLGPAGFNDLELSEDISSASIYLSLCLILFSCREILIACDFSILLVLSLVFAFNCLDDVFSSSTASSLSNFLEGLRLTAIVFLDFGS